MTEAPEASHPLLDFFNVVLGGSPGWLSLRLGAPRTGLANGTYRHASFPQRFYQWPTDAGQLLADVAAAKETSDVYICPAVRSSPDRRKGSAQPPTVCWVDMDQHPTDSALWSQLDPFVIHSGQPGHQHGYIPLTEPIDLDLHERLNKALAERLGGDAKWPENSLLRLPSTYNFKLTVPLNGDAPGPRLPVIPAGHWSGKRWNPRDLAALLGVDLSPTDNGKPRTLALVRTEPGSDDHTAEPVDLDQLPPSIIDHLTGDYPVGTRSEALYELVGRCRRAGYTRGQIIAIAETFPPAVDKYGDRLARQVVDCWEKIGQPAVTTAPPGLPPHTQADDFWDARPILAHVRDFALSRRVSPWATLGVVLARVIAATPCRVVLPPIIGGESEPKPFRGSRGGVRNG